MTDKHTTPREPDTAADDFDDHASQDQAPGQEADSNQDYANGVNCQYRNSFTAGAPTLDDPKRTMGAAPGNEPALLQTSSRADEVIGAAARDFRFLVGFALRCGGGSDSEDIANEALLQALVRQRSRPEDVREILRLVHTIIVRRVADCHRRRRTADAFGKAVRILGRDGCRMLAAEGGSDAAG